MAISSARISIVSYSWYHYEDAFSLIIVEIIVIIMVRVMDFQNKSFIPSRVNMLCTSTKHNMHFLWPTQMSMKYKHWWEHPHRGV